MRCSVGLAASLLLGCSAFVPRAARPTLNRRQLQSAATTLSTEAGPAPAPAAAEVSEDLFWEWRGQKIRYKVCGAANAGPSVVFVHGLFVNADHFRKNLPAAAEAGYRAYALDLLGNGRSSKPFPTGAVAQALNGEANRPEVAAGLASVVLGTASGQRRPRGVHVALAHPLGSCYNFYTWAEQIADFTAEVVAPADGKAVLVANSIGTISAWQAAVDHPTRFDGVFAVSPNFRELHAAESPAFIQPCVRAVQALLRDKGQPLFDALAKPDTVKQILNTPYAVKSAVTDELVSVLLNPLLEPGSADVVFDTLSYSAGPLPEQLLRDVTCPVEVVFGLDDPWTPAARVEALAALDGVAKGWGAVKRVTALPGVGHCPHDEAPEVVNPMVVDFVRRVAKARTGSI